MQKPTLKFHPKLLSMSPHLSIEHSFLQRSSQRYSGRFLLVFSPIFPKHHHKIQGFLALLVQVYLDQILFLISYLSNFF